MTATITAVRVPVQLTTSHGIARQGFESKRFGEFAPPCATDASPAAIEFQHLSILDVRLEQVRIERRDKGWHDLRLTFTEPQTLPNVERLLRQFSEALTTELAAGQEDPWYGNLHLDVSWAGLTDDTPAPPNAVQVRSHVTMTSIQGVAISRERLEGLVWTPLTEIFVDGMRAAQPKTKFLYWFVILEELESYKPFRHLFTPLFSKAERDAVLAAAGAKRPPRLVDVLNTTKLQSRPQRLCRVLHEIGLKEARLLGADRPVDDELCARLFRQRNLVAHKGETIDQDLLYLVLFPLARSALAFLNDQAGSTPTHSAATPSPAP